MNGNQVIEISLDKILPNRFQPRIKFHEKNINELAESIREHGVIQPIVVRKISDKYEIIAGERRYKASVLANKKSIPALIVNLNDKDAAEVALIENVQRQDLTPIEEAVSYKKILDMGMTQEQLAQKLGKTQSTVANKLRLLNLDEEVQEALLEQKISERHARSLLKLSNLKDQVEILNKIISERLTVRKTDQVIKDYLANKTNENAKNKIEVLDIEEKGENNMNNNNNFNIPNNPIEGDTNNNITNNQTFNNGVQDSPIVQPIPDFSMPVQENVTNPGFMDVNKIENQAQDIYVQPEKADVDNLLSEDQKMVEINNQFANQNNETVENANSGKFFNFMPNNNQDSFVPDLEKQETNMNFMPNEEIPQPQFNFDTFFNNNYVETNNTNPVEANQQVSTPQPSVNNMINEAPVNETPAITPTAPVSSVEPVVTEVNSNIVQPGVSNLNQFNFQPESSNINQVDSQSGIVTPTMMSNNNITNNEVNNSLPSSNGFTFEEPVLEPIQSTNPVTQGVESNMGVNSNISVNNFNNTQDDYNDIPQFIVDPNNSFIVDNNEINNTQDDYSDIPQFVVDPNDSFIVNNNEVNNNQVSEEPSMTTPQDLGFNMDFRNINPNESVNNIQNEQINQSINVESTIPNMINNQNVMGVNPESVAPVTPIMTNNNNMVNMGQPVNPTVQAPVLDYNEALNTLKNCCTELQNKGFNISIEQFDLENMAQLVVKIQK